MSKEMIQSLPIIAKALGRNMGVKVKLDAGHPRTDGQVIYLPSLPLNDPGVEALGLGYIIHEAGHIRYSDFSIDYGKLTPLEAKFAGVLEDIRMERCVIRDYPGAPKRLAQLVQRLVQKGFFEPVSENSPPIAVLVKYMLYKLRAHVLGQPALEPYALEAEAKLTELVTDMAMTRIRSVMARITSCKDESEVVELAREVAQILKEESERQQPPQNSQNQNPQQGSGSDQSQNQSQPDDDDDGQDDDTTSDQSDTPSSGDSDGEDGDDPSDQSSDESNQAESDSDDDATDTSNEGSAESDEDSDDDAATASGGSDESDDETDPAFEAAKKTMKEILESDADTLDDLPGDISDAFEELLTSELKEASERGNAPVSMQPTAMKDSVQPGDHQKALDQAEAATSALRSRLIQLVQSQTKAKRRTSRHGRRLNDRKLHRIKSGNTRVYKSVSRKKAVNTAVQVLLDRSYSMTEGMGVASLSTLALTAAMKKIPHLSAGAAFFPGMNSSAATVLTSHDEQMYQTAGYYPRVSANGSTPLLEALMWSGDSLVERKEERKVLIVITDGTPDGFDDCREAIKDLRRAGIEVYGLGIDVNLDMMTELFNGEMTVIQEVGELAQATFSLLENKLIAA